MNPQILTRRGLPCLEPNERGLAVEPMQSPSRNIRFQPDVHGEIQCGVDRLAGLIRPTLGPLPRLVLLGSGQNGAPEQVDSGGMVARHLIGHPLTANNVGMLSAVHALVELHDRLGDGTATCTVMLRRLLADGIRYVGAGGNPQRLREYLNEGVGFILADLDSRAMPLSGQGMLAQLAETVSQDAELAGYLGEIFDVLGEYGRCEVRRGKASGFDTEYVDGMYWNKGMISAAMANQAPRQEAYLENPGIFITNHYFPFAQTVVNVVDAAVRAGFTSLLIIATGFSDEATALLVNQANQERIWTVGVEFAVTGDDRLDFVEDVAALTGAMPIYRKHELEDELDLPSREQLQFAKAEDFGRARRVWVTSGATGISGGQRDNVALRYHIAALQRRHQRERDPATKRKLRVRLGRLIGGSATLWVGGPTPVALEQRLHLAERTAEALRGALHEGVLPGGGAALLACLPTLEARSRSGESLDQQVAYEMLAQALQEPARAIIGNAGYQPDAILDALRRAGNGYGFDALAGHVRQMPEAGILDAASVVKGSIQAAVSAAAALLTTEGIVRTRKTGGSLPGGGAP